MFPQFRTVVVIVVDVVVVVLRHLSPPPPSSLASRTTRTQADRRANANRIEPTRRVTIQKTPPSSDSFQRGTERILSTLFDATVIRNDARRYRYRIDGRDDDDDDDDDRATTTNVRSAMCDRRRREYGSSVSWAWARAAGERIVDSSAGAKMATNDDDDDDDRGGGGESWWDAWVLFFVV